MQNHFFLLFFRCERWSILRASWSRKSRSVPCQNDIDGLSHFGFKSCIFFFFVPVHKECNLCINVNCVAVRLNTFCAFSTFSKGKPSRLSRKFRKDIKKKLFFTQSDFFFTPLFLPFYNLKFSEGKLGSSVEHKTCNSVMVEGWRKSFYESSLPSLATSCFSKKGEKVDFSCEVQEMCQF